MKIISNFKDYYDYANPSFSDESILYKRETKDEVKIKIDKNNQFFRKLLEINKLNRITNNYRLGKDEFEHYFFVIAAKLYSVFSKRFTVEEVFLEEEYYKIFRKNKLKIDLMIEKVDLKMYNAAANQVITQQFLTDLHRQANAPILLFRKKFSEGLLNRNTVSIEVEINPRLLDFKFTKVPANQIYQDIEWFIENELTQKKELIEIADKDKITAHGFDKNSFRHPVKL